MKTTTAQVIIGALRLVKKETKTVKIKGNVEITELQKTIA